MENRCGCCEGTKRATPSGTTNRPGLSAIRYRVGTHAQFLETMKARLSNLSLELPARYDGAGQPAAAKIYPLQNLKTRDADDPAIAVLDAWAVVADVLTFYQERIANEGYLRTATERRSILELARLVGYKLKPGVAASVYLAYTLDDKSEPIEIPAGAGAQSVPVSGGELPQSFETSDPLPARKEWNAIKPRMRRPQAITFDKALTVATLYFDGTETKLKKNDLLLLAFGEGFARQVLRRVSTVKPEFEDDCTEVTLQAVPAFIVAMADIFDRLYDVLVKLGTLPNKTEDSYIKVLRMLTAFMRGRILLGAYPASADTPELKLFRNALISPPATLDAALQLKLKLFSDELAKLKDALPGRSRQPPAQTNLPEVLKSLAVPPSLHPTNEALLPRSLSQTFNEKSDIYIRLLTGLNPRLGDKLYSALSTAAISVARPELEAVYALRVVAPLFGYNVPKITLSFKNPSRPVPLPPEQWEDPPLDEADNRMFLDGAYDQIVPSTKEQPSYIIVNRSDMMGDSTLLYKIREAKVRPRSAYGLNAKTTELVLDKNWHGNQAEVLAEIKASVQEDFSLVRNTLVYTQSEELPLCDEPVTEEISGDRIQLGALYEGLETGRWIIVSGERADITGVSGVTTAEVAMLAAIEQSYPSAGDKLQTTLVLSDKLAYRYKRATVVIYGNVVKATHGETRGEVLGGGDASRPLQEFTLKQPPLTYVSAPTTEGIASTLRVYVNEIEWHETDSIAGLAPDDRSFITRTDDESRTVVVFGTGIEGARPPTGAENIRAVYRNGIGRAGNVKAGQISLLTTRPLGVKEVINPLRASGGADKESRDEARRNVPPALMSLDRLVSTQDYEDFARTFAGVGKASAVRLSDGHRQLVHLTIAGTDDVPIDERSDLYKNLLVAFSKFGDPFQAVQVDARELVALVISAGVQLLPDYQWEAVESEIRAALLYRFGFDQRQLGQPVFLSEVISAVQQVRGVDYVDVDWLDGISEAEALNAQALEKKFEPAPAGGSTTEDEVSQPRQYIPVELAQPVTSMNKKRAALGPDRTILPAQLAILLPSLPDTLILNLLKEVKR